MTQWTLVVAAGATPSPESAAALEALCATYWYPLYAYVRRCGHSPCDAEDLTQEFFARLLEHHWIARADRDRGRFRSFLLTAMKRFMATSGRRSKRSSGAAGCAWFRSVSTPPKPAIPVNPPTPPPPSRRTRGNGR